MKPHPLGNLDTLRCKLWGPQKTGGLLNKIGRGGGGGSHLYDSLMIMKLQLCM